MKNFPKTCPCCHTTYTATTWAKLRHDGTVEIMPGERLEFRTCPAPCSNTMTIDPDQPVRRSTPPATGWNVLGVRMPPGVR